MSKQSIAYFDEHTEQRLNPLGDPYPHIFAQYKHVGLKGNDVKVKATIEATREEISTLRQKLGVDNA